MAYVDKEPVEQEKVGNVTIYRIDPKMDGQCVSMTPGPKFSVCDRFCDIIVHARSSHKGLAMARRIANMIQDD